MNRGAIFLSHVPEEHRARFTETPGLEAALEAIEQSGQTAWPDIRLPSADFLAFLGRCLPSNPGADLSSLRAGDLYLVCAYTLGIPEAGRALETSHMTRVRAALERISTPAAMIADIQQQIRQMLAQSGALEQSRAGYSGRGQLATWLAVSAVRLANRQRPRKNRELPLEEPEAALLVAPGDDPEMIHLRDTYEQVFRAAFKEALSSLSSRERNLLRCHFVEGLSIDQIGDLYGVHRATAARWINRAREALSQRTRDLLAERLSLSQEGFRRMLSLIDSHISVNLADPLDQRQE
jgi:RNA polymerase sigma-70 factor (ECF subfamily)